MAEGPACYSSHMYSPVIGHLYQTSRKAQGVLVQILAADTNDTPVQMSRSCRRCTNIWCHRQCVVSMSAWLSNDLSVTVDIQSVMLLLRAVSLWDNRNSIRYALIGGFVVCLGVSFAFTVSSALRSIGAMSYSPEINACVINENAYHGRITGYMQAYPSIYPELLYDAYVFVIIIANAMNVPRRRDVDIIMNLRRDGVFTFLAFFSLRLLQLLPSVFNNHPIYS